MARVSTSLAKLGRVRIWVGVGAGFAVLALAVAALSQSTAGGDVGDIRAAVRTAIEAEMQVTALPENLRPGHVSDVERQSLKEHIRAEYAQSFARTALTEKLSNVQAIVDRIATDPSAPHLLFYELVSLDMDDPIIAGNSATVTGTFVIRTKSAWDWPDGRTATIGGTGSDSFAFQLERIGGSWFVVYESEQPGDVVPDPSMESNLNPPSPEETKSVPTEQPYKVPPPLQP
jgi:hypothetical protein